MSDGYYQSTAMSVNDYIIDDITTLNYSDVNVTLPVEQSLGKVIVLSIIVAVLSVVTSGGNLLVVMSIQMDKQLQTITNYFLLSLSVADFAIGKLR